MTKTVAVLGSTGSIGRQTLQVVQELGLTVAALTANRQVDLLEQHAVSGSLKRTNTQGVPPVPSETGGAV